MALFKKDNSKEKTGGTIVRFDCIDGKHYPVVGFTTTAGAYIEGLGAAPLPIEEIVEDGFGEAFMQEKSGGTATVLYSKDNPQQFELRAWA